MIRAVLVYVAGVACTVSLTVSANSGDCGPPKVVAPASGTLTDVQPKIEWTPVSGADIYRIQLQSRVPEGKTLVTLDVQSRETSFMPPRPLTDYRATVNVTVTAHCSDGFGAASDVGQGGRFYIDATTLCVLRNEMVVKKSAEAIEISWQPLKQAKSYEVYVYSGTQGELIEHRETQTAQVRLANSFDGNVTVVAIEPRCGAIKGNPQYTLVY